MDVFYYNYNTEKDYILPYIIAPLTGIQDTIIMGPNFITQDKFIREINAEIYGIGARVVNYEDFFNTYMTFSTDCEEIGSERKGLNLTIGVLIHKSIFAKQFHICKFCMQLFIDKFNKIFNMDLYKHGAKEFIHTITRDEINLEYLQSFYESFTDFKYSFR